MNAEQEALVKKHAAFAGRPRVPKAHFIQESLHQVPGIGEPMIDRFMAKVTMPEIREIVGPRKAPFAVDLGCGYGNLTMMLAEKFDRVLGFDQCANKVQWAMVQWTDPAMEFQVRDVTLPIEDVRGADLVHTSTVIQHLTLEDAILALQNVREILRPGGTYVANEGRITRGDRPDALSLSQNHMHAKPLALFQDLGFRLVRRDGTLYVWRKP